MALEQLLLPEALVALVAGEGLLVGVDEHVGLEVALRDGRVGAQVALEALLPVVGLLVDLKGERKGCSNQRRNYNFSLYLLVGNKVVERL